MAPRDGWCGDGPAARHSLVMMSSAVRLDMPRGTIMSGDDHAETLAPVVASTVSTRRVSSSAVVVTATPCESGVTTKCTTVDPGTIDEIWTCE